MKSKTTRQVYIVSDPSWLYGVFTTKKLAVQEKAKHKGLGLNIHIKKRYNTLGHIDIRDK
jgi:hypothetical protein